MTFEQKCASDPEIAEVNRLGHSRVRVMGKVKNEDTNFLIDMTAFRSFIGDELRECFENGRLI